VYIRSAAMRPNNYALLGLYTQKRRNKEKYVLFTKKVTFGDVT